jgi:ribosomal protein S18 acetylase RimI-like enzyme
MKIRKATLDEIHKIKELNTIIFINNPEYDNDAVENFSQTKEGDKYFKKAIENTDGIFLVAEENGELVGYINGSTADFPYRKSKYFEIENLGVIPKAKRKGIGTKLLEELTKIAKEKGYQKIYLNCYAKNDEAINFYKTSGYEKIDVCLEKEI